MYANLFKQHFDLLYVRIKVLENLSNAEYANLEQIIYCENVFGIGIRPWWWFLYDQLGYKPKHKKY